MGTKKPLCAEEGNWDEGYRGGLSCGQKNNLRSHTVMMDPEGILQVEDIFNTAHYVQMNRYTD